MKFTETANPSNSLAFAQSNATIRIAFVINTFDQGGLERCVAHLCNHLDRNQFAPLVICLNRSGTAADWIERNDVPILELHKRDGNDFRVIGRLSEALREQRVDIVHSHNWGTLVETVLARRRAMTPIHVHSERGTVMGTLRHHGIRAACRKRLMNWSLRKVDVVVSNAESTAELVRRLCGMQPLQIQIIPNGVSPPRLPFPDQDRKSIRAELNIPPSAIVVGSLGRLHAVKQFETVIKATALLPEDVHLILVGEGEQHDALVAEANTQGVDSRVHLVGPREDTSRWLAAMDIYINSSRSEGMSQAILEAMAAGLPLVVSDVGDSASLVGMGSEACGLVFPAADVEQCADCLRRLASNAESRLRLGEIARSRQNHTFSFTPMIRSYKELYESFGDLANVSKVRRTPAQGTTTL